MLNDEEGGIEISKTHCQASGKAPKTSPRQCDPRYIKLPWLQATGEEIFEKSPTQQLFTSQSAEPGK
jgi:hypothetical protein